MLDTLAGKVNFVSAYLTIDNIAAIAYGNLIIFSKLSEAALSRPSSKSRQIVKLRHYKNTQEVKDSKENLLYLKITSFEEDVCFFYHNERELFVHHLDGLKCKFTITEDSVSEASEYYRVA